MHQTELLKPFVIVINENKNAASNTDANQKQSNEEQTTWRFGPASYWYETNDPSTYIIAPKEKSSEQKQAKLNGDKKKVIFYFKNIK